jgi:hypothetical protein
MRWFFERHFHIFFFLQIQQNIDYLNFHFVETDTQKINFDDQINIHYKTPIRLERKELVSEDELMNQQADHMKKIYHDEKKRKYMQGNYPKTNCVLIL